MINENNIKTGITEEVLTIKSNTKLIDIFNTIITNKAKQCTKFLNKLTENNTIKKEDKIIIVGTYLTGIGIVKSLKNNNYNNIQVIDIYPHLKELLNSKLGINEEIEFSTDLSQIKTGDIIIDTTGFGGLSPEFSKTLKPKVFIIEDPVAEENDKKLKEKNNINQRLEKVESPIKRIIKTKGLNTKTSGTMTLTMTILTNSITETLKKEGVLYSACEMRFFEDIIFKEKNIKKFINLIDSYALKVSTITKYNIDETIKTNIDKIKYELIEFKNI